MLDDPARLRLLIQALLLVVLVLAISLAHYTGHLHTARSHWLDLKLHVRVILGIVFVTPVYSIFETLIVSIATATWAFLADSTSDFVRENVEVGLLLIVIALLSLQAVFFTVRFNQLQDQL